MKNRKNALIGIEELRRVIRYDPEDGHIYSKISNRFRSIGDRVDIPTTGGYLRACVKGVDYKANRLIWYYVYGTYPPPEIDVDHIDGDRSNNKLINLRLLDRSNNNYNTTKPSKNNKSGFLGVSLHKASGLYRATIFKDYKQILIGYFKTPEEANDAYVKKKTELFEEKR